MTVIEHNVTHHYQPTNHACGPTAAVILLSHFGIDVDPLEAVKKIPIGRDEHGEELGTVPQQVATWCMSLGFAVDMHSADFQILDLSWSDLSVDELLERLEAVKDHRNVPSLGKKVSRLYVEAYIDFVKGGGQLQIHPYMTTKLFDELLLTGPFWVNVSYGVMYNEGRTRSIGLRKSVSDDGEGSIPIHTVVVYGKNEDGNYLVVDPWREPGWEVIKPDQLICSITASETECDALIFQLTEK